MSRCRHAKRHQTRMVVPERLRCDKCRDYLPLGPARDTAETEVEVRAAAIAAGWWGEPGLTSEGKNGLMAHAAGLTPINDGQWAGWLGAEIATHKESDRG